MEWRPIPGHDSYAVSNDGQVKLIKDTMQHCAGYILKSVNSHGYRRVRLRLHKNNYKGFQVHRLVALAFLGEPPEGRTEINHKDGNKANNCAENLEWCNRSENLLHSVHVLGNTPAHGEGLGRNLVTDDIARSIRQMASDGMKIKAIATHFGLGYGLTWQIIKRLIWKHVP